MSDFSKELKQYLQKKGCSFECQGKGDHEIWFSPITNIRFVVDNQVKSRHLPMLFKTDRSTKKF